MFGKLFEKNLHYPLIFICSLFLGALFDVLFYDKLIGLNFFIFAIFVMSFFILLNELLLKKEFNLWALLSIPALILSFEIFIYDNSYVKRLVPLIVLGLFLIVSQTVFSKRFKTNGFLLNYLAAAISDIIVSLVTIFSNLFFLPKDLFASQKKDSLLAKIMIGLLISVPIVIVLLVLLSSADMIFKSYVDNVFANFSNDFFIHFLLVGFVAMFFYSLAKFYLKDKKPIDDGPNTTQIYKRYFDPVITSVILVSINFVFLIFISIQFKYLFYGLNELLANGISYAEYAHKGFGELIFVSIAIFILLVWFYYYTNFKSKAQLVFSRIFNTILIIQTVIIGISAFKRLNIYETAYGFTHLRIYVQLFIIWLALVFLILLINILVDKFSIFRSVIIVSSIVFFVLVFAINIDGYIATKNIDRYLNDGKELDVYYMINDLSYDAIPQMIMVADFESSADARLKYHYSYNIYNKRGNRLEENSMKYYLREYLTELNEHSSWQEFNLSKLKAKKMLTEYFSKN